MKRKINIIVAGACIGAVLLTGCQVPENDKVLIKKQQQTEISFSWWGNDERHQYTLEGIDIFENSHPQIDVEESYGVWDGYEQRNQIAMKAHTGADVMLINYSWMHTYSEDGQGYYDLNDVADLIDLSQFSKDDLKIGTMNGHLNALPTAYNMSVTYYNQDLYEKYGLDIPKTWDDLFAAAKVMSKDGIYPLGMVKKHLFLFLQANYEQTTGKKLFDEEGKVLAGDEDIEKLLRFYKTLVEKKVLMPIDEYDSNSFFNQKIAGVQCWLSDSSITCKSLQDEGVQVVQGDLIGLQDTDTTGWYMKPATMYAISAFTSHPREAAQLVDFLLNDPEMAILQNTEKGVPVSHAAYKTLQKEGMLNSLESLSTEYLNRKKGQLELIYPIMEDNEIINGFKSISDGDIYEKESLNTCVKKVSSLMQSRSRLR